MVNKEPRVLVYDIETTPVLFWGWRCGKQVVRHDQLHDQHNVNKIICITYQWLHEKKPKALVFNLRTQDDTKVIREFDKLLQEADIVIGKNNARFDNKHVNFRRMMNGLPPFPDWIDKSDDLEKQMRKYFNMPSYALDYFSKLTGIGGKIKMSLQDWIDIVQHKDKKALDKMVKYGKKDAEDTVKLIKKVWPHIRPKYNKAKHYGDHRCTQCGSQNIRKNGTRVVGNTLKQSWYCNDHGGFAGYTTVLKNGGQGDIKP